LESLEERVPASIRSLHSELHSSLHSQAADALSAAATAILDLEASARLAKDVSSALENEKGKTRSTLQAVQSGRRDKINARNVPKALEKFKVPIFILIQC